MAPLLAVKQTIPPVPPGAVRRAALENRLSYGGTRLTLVVAPAGWGKTALLSRWAADLGPSTRVAWLSLDAGDAEPVRFWRYLISALQATSDVVGPEAPRALTLPGSSPLDQAIPLLLNDLAGTDVAHVLVLDDFHLVDSSEVHEQVEYFLSYLPANVRLVVASRQDPPLPVARLRARGQLTELRADDLRFDRAETSAMLSALTGWAVDEPTSGAASTRTEGWAAGLQLVGLGLRTRPAADGWELAAGRDRHVLDFFSAEVLPALTGRQRDLLIRSTPLERLSGPLCDAALLTTGSATVLDELERASLFVTALDAGHEWYRCHQLFREALLRDTAEGTAPIDDRHDVLRRAADWFEQRGLLDEAVGHLVRAGDDRAATLLAASQPWFFDRGLTGSFLALGDSLPAGSATPELALALAYAAESSGRRNRIAYWLDACEAALGPDSAVPGWRDPRAALLMMRGLVGTPDDEAEQSLELIRSSVAREREAGETEPHTALLALGAALVHNGQFDRAADVLGDRWRSRDRGEWAVGVVLQLAGLLGFALIELDRGPDLQRLLREAGPLADRVESDWATADSSVALLRLVQGRSLYLGGRPRESRDLLRGLATSDGPARAWARLLRSVYLADAELACGDRSAGRAALGTARDLATDEPVPAFVLVMLEDAEARIGRGAARAAVRSGGMVEQLTDRELAVLRALAGPASQREIGALLYLSINTIKAYTKSLYRKLGVGSRAEAVAAGRELGLI